MSQLFSSYAPLALIVGYLLWEHRIENRGVVKERVRVEAKGKVTDAKATAARSAAERDPRGMLKRWERD